AERWRRMRLHGMSGDSWRRYHRSGTWRYTVADAGMKANLTDLQAAIGREQLHRLRSWQRRRAAIAARYDAQLGSVRGLGLPPRPAADMHAWHLYIVRVHGRAFGMDRTWCPSGWRKPASARPCISSRFISCRTSATCWAGTRAVSFRPRTRSSRSCSRCRCIPGCPIPTRTACARHWPVSRPEPPEPRRRQAAHEMEIAVLTGSRDAGDRQFTVFDSQAAPADERMLERLGEGTDDAGLAAPPVVLPDFCHKAKSEMPSSIAVATAGEIRPALTDAALNCGMALMTLDIERPPARSVTDFYRQVAERFPSPPNWRRELTARDVLLAATEGADFAAERFGLTGDELDRIEERGRLDIDAYGGAARAARELPWLVVQMSRLRFGAIGPSTHFLELQEVEDILDPAAAAELGIRPGQVTVQFHNGGGVLTGQLGALYARRKSASRMLRAEMSVQKPLSHLLPPRSGLRQRLAAYFSAGCPAVPVDGDDGRRVRRATGWR